MWKELMLQIRRRPMREVNYTEIGMERALGSMRSMLRWLGFVLPVPVSEFLVVLMSCATTHHIACTRGLTNLDAEDVD